MQPERTDDELRADIHRLIDELALAYGVDPRWEPPKGWVPPGDYVMPDWAKMPAKKAVSIGRPYRRWGR
jgi:hypothetical protein